LENVCKAKAELLQREKNKHIYFNNANSNVGAEKERSH
jgi:UDP-N-acetylmuramyl pentapeptide synthase